MINVTKETDVVTVDNLCMSIYSQPGLGKTSLAFTASKPILFDFDNGIHRAPNRKDAIRAFAWSDVAGVRAEDVAGYDTIIIDTVGKALDALAQDIIRSNSKLGYGGVLNQQGWGQLSRRFSAFVTTLRGFGKDVILVSHLAEQKDGDEIKERLKIQGGSKDFILTDSDTIARIVISDKHRYLDFSPNENSFGKDPARLGSVAIPELEDDKFSTCLTDIIADIKAKLNELSEAQLAQKGEVDWFTQSLPDVMDADGINALLSRAKKAGTGKLVVARANELQLEFDAEARKYVYLEQSGEDTPEPEEATQ